MLKLNTLEDLAQYLSFLPFTVLLTIQLYLCFKITYYNYLL